MAIEIADAAGSWNAGSFTALAGGIGFGLLIILVAPALHVLVAIEENTREMVEVMEGGGDESD